MKTHNIQSGIDTLQRQTRLHSRIENTTHSISIDDVNDSEKIKAILTKEYLRGLNTRPRVHNNGFIQLDLSQRRRLHVWHFDIPENPENAPFHDHVFGFRSWALVGKLTNIIYELDFNKRDFEIYTPRITKGCDSALEPTGKFCGIKPKTTNVIAPKGNSDNLPDSYGIEPFEFHGTFVSEPTVTVIDKTAPTLAQNPTGPRPRVLMPVGNKPNSSYSQYSINPEELWRIIEEVLNL